MFGPATKASGYTAGLLFPGLQLQIGKNSEKQVFKKNMFKYIIPNNNLVINHFIFSLSRIVLVYLTHVLCFQLGSGLFGPAWDCGVVFPIGLWVGLILSLFFAIICCWGFTMLANINVMIFILVYFVVQIEAIEFVLSHFDKFPTKAIASYFVSDYGQIRRSQGQVHQRTAVGLNRSQLFACGNFITF